MQIANDITLRSARNKLLSTLFAPRDQEFSIGLPTDVRDSFLIVSYRGTAENPSVKIVRGNADGDDFKIDFPKPGELTITIKEETIATKDITKDWTDHEGFSLGPKDMPGNISTFSQIGLIPSIKVTPADQLIPYPLKDLPIIHRRQMGENETLGIVYVLGTERDKEVRYLLHDEIGQEVADGTVTPSEVDLNLRTDFDALIEKLVSLSQAYPLVYGTEGNYEHIWVRRHTFMNPPEGHNTTDFVYFVREPGPLEEVKYLIKKETGAGLAVAPVESSAINVPNTLEELIQGVLDGTFGQEETNLLMLHSKAAFQEKFAEAWGRATRFDITNITDERTYFIRGENVQSKTVSHHLSAVVNFRVGSIKDDLKVSLRKDGETAITDPFADFNIFIGEAFFIIIEGSQNKVFYQIEEFNNPSVQPIEPFFSRGGDIAIPVPAKLVKKNVDWQIRAFKPGQVGSSSEERLLKVPAIGTIKLQIRAPLLDINKGISFVTGTKEVDYDSAPNIKIPSPQEGVTYELFAYRFELNISAQANLKGVSLQSSSDYDSDGDLLNIEDLKVLFTNNKLLSIYTFVNGEKPLDLQNTIKEDCLLVVRLNGENVWLEDQKLALVKPDKNLTLIEKKDHPARIQISNAQANVGYRLQGGTISMDAPFVIPLAHRIGWSVHNQTFGMQVRWDGATDENPGQFKVENANPALEIDNRLQQSLQGTRFIVELVFPLTTDPTPKAVSGTYRIEAIKEYTGLLIDLGKTIIVEGDGSINISI